MAYRDNVNKIASELGISNDPGLREEDILIKEMHFITLDFETVVITATDMNRGGRLFLQHASRTDTGEYRTELDLSVILILSARAYFAELWSDSPDRIKRPLIEALRASTSVTLVFKDQA